jgi:(1->4)-alpha-D-glucan 1-alpha-D-glucosylmutase
MLGLSTHDTKRSEDVRARISLLSEIPDQWEATLKRWREMNASLKLHDVPDPNTEYFLYQTLIGAWPIDTERLLPYMEKAAREAKAHTTWLSPNKHFEEGTKHFIEGLYKNERFQEDLQSFVQTLTEPGRINSLAQLLLKLTSPGIPDTYQGCELWDLSLVDPDNRRPVDYEKRRQLLAELPKLSVKQIWDRCDEGLPKLWTTYRIFHLRRNHPEYFGPKAAYTPIFAEGSKAEHLVGYARGENVVVLVPRLVMKLAGNWENTTVVLPVGNWRNQLTDSRVSGGKQQVASLFDSFPLALLVRE